MTFRTRIVGCAQVAILLVTLVSSSLLGQELETDERESRQEHSRRAEVMRNAGIALSIIGIAGEIVGIGFIIEGNAGYDPAYPDQGPGMGWVVGGIVMGVSAVPLLIGIPLWVVGKKRMKNGPKRAAIPRLFLTTQNGSRSEILIASWSF